LIDQQREGGCGEEEAVVTIGFHEISGLGF
jgi:hypothetical protein